MAAKLKALQQWCKVQCEGYRDVSITNMTSSWKSGLAFCAIIHRYRPDLINYDSLSKENVYENNKLAFDVAKELGIPALLDPEDMVIMTVPDKLCIITYVSQYYNYFRSYKPVSAPTKRHLPDVASNAVTAKKPVLTPSNDSVRNQPPDEARSGKSLPNSTRRGTLEDTCNVCKSKVFLMERQIDGGKLYHRHCLRNMQKEQSATLRMSRDDDETTNISGRGTLGDLREHRSMEVEENVTTKEALDKEHQNGSHSVKLRRCDPNSGNRGSLSRGSSIEPNSGSPATRNSLLSSPGVTGNESAKAAVTVKVPPVISDNDVQVIKSEASFTPTVNVNSDVRYQPSSSVVPSVSKPSPAEFPRNEITTSSTMTSNTVVTSKEVKRRSYVDDKNPFLDDSAAAAQENASVLRDEQPKTSSDHLLPTSATQPVPSPSTHTSSSPSGTLCQAPTAASSELSSGQPKQVASLAEVAVSTVPKSDAGSAVIPPKPPRASMILLPETEDRVVETPPTSSHDSSKIVSFASHVFQKPDKSDQSSAESGAKTAESAGKKTVGSDPPQLSRVDSTSRQVVLTPRLAPAPPPVHPDPSAQSHPVSPSIIRGPNVPTPEHSSTSPGSKPSAINTTPSAKEPVTGSVSVQSGSVSGQPGSVSVQPGAGQPLAAPVKSVRSVRKQQAPIPPTVVAPAVTSQPGSSSINVTGLPQQPVGSVDKLTAAGATSPAVQNVRGQMGKVSQSTSTVVTPTPTTTTSLTPVGKTAPGKVSSSTTTVVTPVSTTSTPSLIPVGKTPPGKVSSSTTTVVTPAPTASAPVGRTPPGRPAVPPSGHPTRPPSILKSSKVQINLPVTTNPPSSTTASVSASPSPTAAKTGLPGKSVDLPSANALHSISSDPSSKDSKVPEVLAKSHENTPTVETNAKPQKPNDDGGQSVVSGGQSVVSGGSTIKQQPTIPKRPPSILVSPSTGQTQNVAQQKSEIIDQTSSGGELPPVPKRPKNVESKDTDAQRRTSTVLPDSQNTQPKMSEQTQSNTRQITVPNRPPSILVTKETNSSGSALAEVISDDKPKANEASQTRKDPVGVHSNAEVIGETKPEPVPAPRTLPRTNPFCLPEQSPVAIQMEVNGDGSASSAAETRQQEANKSVVRNSENKENVSQNAHRDAVQSKQDPSPRPPVSKAKRDAPVPPMSSGSTWYVDIEPSESQQDKKGDKKSHDLPGKPVSPIPVPRSKSKKDDDCSAVSGNAQPMNPATPVPAARRPVGPTPNRNSEVPPPSVVSPKDDVAISGVKSSPPPRPVPPNAESVERARKKIAPDMKFTFEEPSFNFGPTAKPRNASDGRELHMRSSAVVSGNNQPVVKRKVNAEDRLSTEYITTQIKYLDSELKKLEREGRILEDRIRSGTDDAMDDDDQNDVMGQWFEMISRKNDLVRQETDLIYRCKQQELEGKHEELEFELRCLMNKPDRLKTAAEKKREETLLQKLLQTVSQRNSIVESMEEDRLRYIKEDEEIAQMLTTSGLK